VAAFSSRAAQVKVITRLSRVLPNIAKWTTPCKLVERRQQQESFLLTSTASGDSINETNDDDSGILPASIAVGTVTAAMGFVYGQVLSNP